MCVCVCMVREEGQGREDKESLITYFYFLQIGAGRRSKDTKDDKMSPTDIQILSRDVKIASSISSKTNENSSIPPKTVLNIRYCATPSTPPPPPPPTVICLPFWGGSAATFDKVLLELASGSGPQGSRIGVAVSYRGTGWSSSSSRDEPRDHDIPALAADILALLHSDDMRDLLPSGEIVICAHSMSAKVVWEMLPVLLSDLEHRSRQSSVMLEGLLLLGPAPVGPLVFPPEAREQQLRAYESFDSAEWTLRNVLTCSGKLHHDDVIRKLANDCIGMSPGAKRGWIEHGMKRDYTDVVKLVAASQRRTVSLWDGKGRVKNKLKVRVLVGEEDQVETVQRVKTQTVDVLRDTGGFDVEFETIAGCGHLLPVEAPREVVAELEKIL